MATRRNTPLLASTVVTLSAATSFGLTRVFGHTTWLLALIVAAVLAVAVVECASAFEWSGANTVALLTAVGFWWSAIVTRPHEVWFGLPTLTSIRHWFEALGHSGSVLRTAVVPVAPQGAALQLAIVIVFITAIGSAWSATKPDGAINAIVPQLALFIALAALGKHGYVMTAVVWTAAVTLFLLTHQNLASVTNQAAFQAQRPRPSRLIVGGAAGAAFAIIVGAVVGPQLPSASSAPLLRYRDFGASRDGPGTITAISPLVRIKDQLNKRNAVELFVVRANAPARWRLVALDSFDNNSWGLSKNASTAGSLDDLATDQGGIGQSLIQNYAIGPMSGKFLPAAYRARSVSRIKGLFIIAPSASLVVNDENHQGVHYTAESELTGATADELRGARTVDPQDQSLKDDLALPNNVPRRIIALAQNLTSHANTSYDKAMALQQYFRANFGYDTTVNLSESDNAMVDFLFKIKRGFCEQFAGTFAVMARAIGLPTRVATGFQPGDLKSDGYHVTTKQAHAWPEVYFAHIGWIAFEPTPGIFDRESPGNPNRTATGASPPPPTGPGATTTTANKRVPTTTTSNIHTPLPKLPKDRILTEPSSGRVRSTNVSVPVRVGVALGVMGMLVGIPIGGFRFWRWGRRRRREFDPSLRARITGAWAHANEHLAWIEVRRRASTTPVEFAMREAPAVGIGDAGPALLELAQLHTAAMYGPDEPVIEEADAAWRCVDSIDRALRTALHTKRHGWLVRLRW